MCTRVCMKTIDYKTNEWLKNFLDVSKLQQFQVFKLVSQRDCTHFNERFFVCH